MPYAKDNSTETLTKKDLIKAIKLRYPKASNAEIKRFLVSFTDAVLSALCEGKGVRIDGLCRMFPTVKAERTAYNPHSDTKFVVPERLYLKTRFFKSATARLRESLDPDELAED